MSRLIPVTIDNILDGWSITEFLSGKDQYQNSVGIDPEAPRFDGGVKPSGILRPTALGVFSGGNINARPVLILTNPKTSDIYVGLSNGRVVKYDKNLANETLIYDNLGEIDGGFYQNDYLYFIYPNDVARYGPLSGTPTMNLNVWTNSTLGSQTALNPTTFPKLLGGGYYPQHFGFVHGDNKGYFFDYKDGQGMVHYIKTLNASTNDSSTYNALDLPFGMLPTCGASYGNDVAVGTTKVTSDSVVQGKSAVYFWDTVDTSFYREVLIPGVLTALFCEGGKLYAWSGSISGKGKHRLYLYDGNLDFIPVKIIPEGFPPPPHAVDSFDGRIVWGSFISDPALAAVVYAYGGISNQALHAIFKSNIAHTLADGMISALKWVLQDITGLVIGAKNDVTTTNTLEKVSSTYGTSIFRSKMFNIGQNFTVKEVKMPLGATLAANMNITPTLYIDDGSKTSILRDINITNNKDVNRNRLITSRPQKPANGQNDFFLELKWTGSVLLPVLLPITIIVEVED